MPTPELADRILSGKVNRADAAVCGQLLNVKLRDFAALTLRSGDANAFLTFLTHEGVAHNVSRPVLPCKGESWLSPGTADDRKTL
jgi:hypothetical protein